MAIPHPLPKDDVDKLGEGDYNDKEFTLDNAYNYLSPYPNLRETDRE